MKIGISSGAEADVADGYWFFDRQSLGLGDYFRFCIFAFLLTLNLWYTSAEFTRLLMASIDRCRNDSRLAFTIPLIANS